MTSTEDRARAAMRAIAGTVGDAPPLRLTQAGAAAPGTVDAPASDAAPRGRRGPRPSGAPRRPWRTGPPHRWRWSVLAPVAAAVTVVAVAVALVLVKDLPNGRVAAPATSPSASAVTGPTDMPAPTGLPRYYAALIQADTPSLVVGDTMTGQLIAALKAPDGVAFQGVYGNASTDRTFVVTGERMHGAGAGGTAWYQLTITPDRSDHARLTPLPIPVAQSPAGVALSPDGTKLAVAVPGRPTTLRVYATETGTLLRAWPATAPGEIATENLQPGLMTFPGTSLRWSADGRQLAFAWNASAIRVLDATAPDGDLLGSSRLLAGIGTGDGLDGASYTCDAAHGWALIAGGQGIICAGSLGLDSSSCADGTCTHGVQTFAGFLRQAPYGQGGSEGEFLDRASGCSDHAQPREGAYLGWANADGSVLIGSFVCDQQSRFGAFRGNGFAPLPALPGSVPVPAGVRAGTLAW